MAPVGQAPAGQLPPQAVIYRDTCCHRNDPAGAPFAQLSCGHASTGWGGAPLALLLEKGMRSFFSLPVACVIALTTYLIDGWIPGNYALSGPTTVAFSVLVFAAASHDITEERSWLGGALMVKLGEWSYAFYLFHALVLAYVIPRLTARWNPSPEIMWLTALAICLAIAGFLYSYVERPLERILRGKSKESNKGSITLSSTAQTTGLPS
jgi:peptidoglycan/LPS O-acetylase OafA/YrhL